MKALQTIIVGSFCMLASAAAALPRASDHPNREARSQTPGVAWRFVEDFSHGIRGWMSFPLAEDIGYDPSLYTTGRGGHFCLERDVIAEGQSNLRIGFVRSIGFHILPQSSIQLRYRIATTGRPGSARFFAAGVSGKRYAVAIPASLGKHVFTVHGVALGVPTSGEDIEAVAVQATVLNPERGASNRLVLEEMKIDARRKSDLALRVEFPALNVPAGGGMPVDGTIVRSDAPVLRLQLDTAGPRVRVALFNGEGREVNRSFVANRQKELGSPSPGLWRAHLATKGAVGDFRFLVLGGVPPHPRLLLTPERLEQLRSQMPSDVLQKLVQQHAALAASQVSANAAAGANILRMSSDSLFPGLTQYFQLLDDYGDAIVLNALDFRLRGSIKSLQAARLALLAAAHWPTWTPPWFPAHGLQSYYEPGIFSQRAALGYDLIADRLSTSERREIADAFYRNAIRPVVTDYFLNDRMPMADSNHMAHSIGGAIAACMAMYGDVTDWDSRFGPALAELIAAYERLLANMFPSDSSDAEPVGYQEFAMEGISMGAAALERAGIRPQGTDHLLQSFLWPYYAQYKPGYELDTGDEIGTLFAHSGFAWAAETSSDPRLQMFYQSATTRTLAALFHTGAQTTALPNILDLTCCTKEPRSVAPLPLSRIFPDRGSAALRSGWDTESTLISIRVGPWFNHGHHDEGSFQVASHGEVLVGEAGYTSYYSDPRFADYFTQAPGHNTVLIDHNAFSQDAFGSSRWKAFADYPRFTHHLLGDGLDFLEADLQPAYPDIDLTHYSRQYVFFKPGFVFVHDSISSTRAHAYSFLVHPGDDIQPQLNGSRAMLQGSHASALLIADPGAKPWQMTAAPLPTIAYADFDKSAIRPRSTLHLEAPAARTANFTVGIQLLAPASVIGTLQSLSTHDAEGFSAEAGGVEVLFRKAAGELALQMYATDGDILASNTTSTKRRVFAGDARWLRSGSQTAMSAAQPVDAEVTYTVQYDRWEIFCSQASSVQIAVSDRIKSALIDNIPIPPSAGNRLLELNLQPGEHRVDVLY